MISWIILEPGKAIASETIKDDPDSIIDQVEKDVEFRYKARLTGVDDQSLLEKLRSASQLVTLEVRPPPSLVALERRARNDIERLQKVLRSEAYYDSRVEYRIESDSEPVQIFVDISIGVRYLLKQYTITYSGPGSEYPDLPQEPGGVGVIPGQPARAELVTGARQRLIRALADMGHPLAKVEQQSAVVDHADNSMSVLIEVIPGEQSRFGPLEIVGAVSVEQDYIKSFVPWQEGDIYDRRKLDQARQQLLGTGLFSAVAFERPNQVDADAKLPVTIRVKERKHRSIGLGGSWSTDQGISIEAEWEHRNIFGRGERISYSGEISEIKREFVVAFKKPRYRRQDQDLLANGALAYEDTDAFKGPLTRYFAGLQRQLNENWKVVGGIPFEISDLSDLQGSRNFTLYGLEFRGERDTSNDRLDPNAGTRLRLLLQPISGSGEESINFITGLLGLAGYHAIDHKQRYIIAGRTRLGSITGETTEDLPANKRFYAGGGSSIRGYRFQSVGPLGPGNTPLGGRSLFEISTEFRVKFSDTIGGVIFVDGGNVYDDELPDFSTNLQWAGGFGARYFTSFGPIRLDLGFPLNPRDGIDDPMQLYISIGQAF
ncbi:MAG: autotransporter assembly complex family protein [Gammaproteobacteria bacterium]